MNNEIPVNGYGKEVVRETSKYNKSVNYHDPKGIVASEGA